MSTYEQFIGTILEGIAKLSEEHQISIWTAKKNSSNALMLAAQLQPTAVPALLDGLSNLRHHTQVHILRPLNVVLDPHDRRVDEYRTNLHRLINNKIAELNASDPIEQAIKVQLKSMRFNAAYKQALVIDAFLALKSSPNYTKSSLVNAINDKNSALYNTLNLKRYGCWPFSSHSEARSIKKIRDVARLQFFKNQASIEEEGSTQKTQAPKDIIPHILIPLLP